VTRHVETPRVLAAPRQERQHIGSRNLGGEGRGQGSQIAGQPNPNVARQHGAPNGAPSARIGRNATPQNQPNRPSENQITHNQNWQSPGRNRGATDRVLRNAFFANKSSAAGDPAARLLARSTFHGRFLDHDRRHHPHPIVIGWVGPVFWPYAYDDFVDYTFYPYAYDTFWPSAYDDVYDGMFGRYAYGSGSAYASVRRSGTEGGGARTGAGTGGSTATDLCSGQTAGLTDWPIERIAQAIEPDDAQRATLDELKEATAKALDVLKAACPTDLPSTPTGRLAAMHQRLDAMLQAVRTVRPVLEKLYQTFNDEQKARFNALGTDEDQDQQSRRNLAQVCGERSSGIAGLPIEQIERTVQPNDAQRTALKQLQEATAQAVDVLKSNCPTYRALTPVVRLQVMEQRLDAMRQAVQIVEPALTTFYGSLNDEQKERFNRMSPRQA
jgi:ABC-type transporter MlaC component